MNAWRKSSQRIDGIGPTSFDIATRFRPPFGIMPLVLFSSLAGFIFPMGLRAAETAPSAETAGTPVSGSTPTRIGPQTFPTTFDSIIEDAATRHGVSAALVRAVVKVESNFKPDARSPKGALGLMQLLPSTALELGATALFDPHTNINAGTRHLKRLLDRYSGSAHLALAAYNAGQGAVEKYGRKIPPYPETEAYVKKVLAHAGSPDLIHTTTPGRNERVSSFPERRDSTQLQRVGALIGTILTGGGARITRKQEAQSTSIAAATVSPAVVGGVWTNVGNVGHKEFP